MKRECGGCTLCCRLLPVKPLGKFAGQRCVHQRTGKGCAVYHKLPQVSVACAVWTCRWLTNDDTGNLRRPDRSHYVIDVMPDFITIGNSATGEQQHQEVLQIWIDPGFPDAHEDPELRAYIARQNLPALLRYNATDAKVLFPPALCENQEWNFVTTGMRTTEHKLTDVMAVLAGREPFRA
jgi:hypothetical protein